MLRQEQSLEEPQVTGHVPVISSNTPHGAFTRRDFLRVSGLAVGTLVTLSAVDRALALEPAMGSSMQHIQSAVPLPPLIIGTIKSVEAVGTVRVYSRQAGLVMVRVHEGARIQRGILGVDQRVESFRTGDAIVAEGTWSDGSFMAYALESAFQVVAGKVDRRVGQMLTVAGQQVLLRDETPVFAGYGFIDTTLAAIATGDMVIVATWYDPEPATMVAARLALVQRAT